MSFEAEDTLDTLRILHLPSNLSDERREELFQKYGATKTHTIRSSSKYTITFAKFPSHNIAHQALLRLHQLKIRDQYLSVEFAKKSIPIELSRNESCHEDVTKDEIQKETTNKTHFQNFLSRLYGWKTNQVFTQPPSPNIRYKYTAPTGNTLLRIAIQLLKEPAFYTQVLHLMNRMCLPPPFEELESEFPVLKEIYDVKKYKNIFGNAILKRKNNIEEEEEEDDEEESEIESDKEENEKLLQNIPIKRKRSQSTKRIKIPKFVNPAKQILPTSTQRPIRPEDMFEPVQHGETKNLKIELKNVDKDRFDKINETNPNDTPTLEGGFGLIPSIKPAENIENDVKEQDAQKQEFITPEELMANRISANDQRLLPVFKNYHAGKPSNRLYIKNLAKQVEEKDLHFIYQKYVLPKLSKSEHEYNVRLMQEGRMKGQAFIALQNVAQAQLALEETNGYILKDKPMVVQFAKVANS